MLTRLLLSTTLVAMTLPMIASSGNARSKPAEIVVVGPGYPKSGKHTSLPTSQRLFRIGGATTKHSGMRGNVHNDFIWQPRGSMGTKAQIQRPRRGVIANYR